MPTSISNSLANEKELFRRVALGDEQAFNLVYGHFLELMGGAILQLVKSEADVKEVLQEAFMRVWLNRDKLHEIENPGGWVRRIVVNECYRLIKKNKLRARSGHALPASGTAEPHSSYMAEHGLVMAETRKLIQEAIAELSPRQHTIYILSRESGKTNPEIAQMLGLTPDYVKKTLATALLKMRKKLAEAGKLLPAALLL